MKRQLADWHPSEIEVARIVAEMRPLIQRLAVDEQRRCSFDPEDGAPLLSEAA